MVRKSEDNTKRTHFKSALCIHTVVNWAEHDENKSTFTRWIWTNHLLMSNLIWNSTKMKPFSTLFFHYFNCFGVVDTLRLFHNSNTQMGIEELLLFCLLFVCLCGALLVGHFVCLWEVYRRKIGKLVGFREWFLRRQITHWEYIRSDLVGFKIKIRAIWRANVYNIGYHRKVMFTFVHLFWALLPPGCFVDRSWCSVFSFFLHYFMLVLAI